MPIENFKFQIVNSILEIGNQTCQIAYWKMEIRNCQLQIAHCKLQMGNCQFLIVNFKTPFSTTKCKSLPLPIVYCKMPIENCQLRIANCKLPIVQGVPENCLRSTISAISFKPLSCQKRFTTHFNPCINTFKMNSELAVQDQEHSRNNANNLEILIYKLTIFYSLAFSKNFDIHSRWTGNNSNSEFLLIILTLSFGLKSSCYFTSKHFFQPPLS